MTEHRETPGRFSTVEAAPSPGRWTRRARWSTGIETARRENMGTDWFRLHCAAVSISLLRRTRRKTTERANRVRDA
ncbi:hypothetical protein BURMUCGD1_4446 [Burkholderia multivorans CGD1]|nr:hypothetical protein BURMUCGD1_4446 [Burkholderia multivorans CGD1]